MGIFRDRMEISAGTGMLAYTRSGTDAACYRRWNEQVGEDRFSITPEAQVGLSLRILCGFGIEEIADAFLTNKETFNKRLFRAKEKIREEKIPIDLPGPAEMGQEHICAGHWRWPSPPQRSWRCKKRSQHFNAT